LTCEAEALAAFRLRHDIFHLEHWGRRLPGAIDRDEFDRVSDHIGVFEGERLIGCYRLASSLTTSTFYASGRFDLMPLRLYPGPILELGRACIAADRRVGAPLLLLWRAIDAYARAIGARLLFGSASIRTDDLGSIADVVAALQADAPPRPRLGAAPLPGRSIAGLDERLERMSATDRDEAAARGRAGFNALFRAYLSAGAAVCGLPALDRAMGSADFLMALPVAEMAASFSRRCLGARGESAEQPISAVPASARRPAL
jgi:putative hemolysin